MKIHKHLSKFSAIVRCVAFGWKSCISITLSTECGAGDSDVFTSKGFLVKLTMYTLMIEY